MTRPVIIVLLAAVLWHPAVMVAQRASPGLTIHVVQRDETLFIIAANYGLTVEELAKLNGITDSGNIRVGQRLLVPSNEAPTLGSPRIHIVQPGETLSSIAALYGTGIVALLASNNLNDANEIYVGLPLTVNNVSQVAALPLSETRPAPQPFFHTVQPGETVYGIAQRYGVEVNEVSAANNLSDPSLIFVGQQILIPGLEVPPLALDIPAPIISLEMSPLILTEGQSGRIRITTNEVATISANFLGREFPAALDESGLVHTVLVAIPVFTRQAVYPITLTVAVGDAQPPTRLVANVLVVAGGYGREQIDLLGDRQELLAPAVEESEQKLLERVMGMFNPERYFTGPLGLPAAAPTTSLFGTIRTYDGVTFDRFHSGTDFAGPPGAPIFAPAPGRVVLADTLNVRGSATVIDHGWGVYTGYWHQTDRLVQVGDFVEAGQTIGTIGSTGRVTGPHLHWELWVNGIPVDPMQWVRQSFA